METSCEQWALERQPEGLRRTRKMVVHFLVSQSLCKHSVCGNDGWGNWAGCEIHKFIFVKHQQSG